MRRYVAFRNKLRFAEKRFESEGTGCGRPRISGEISHDAGNPDHPSGSFVDSDKCPRRGTGPAPGGNGLPARATGVDSFSERILYSRREPVRGGEPSHGLMPLCPGGIGVSHEGGVTRKLPSMPRADPRKRTAEEVSKWVEALARRVDVGSAPIGAGGLARQGWSLLRLRERVFESGARLHTHTRRERVVMQSFT